MSVIGTIYKSFSGLMGFNKALDNASNNISNMNTPGYKGRDLFFQELSAFPDGQGERYAVHTENEGGGVIVSGSEVRFNAGDINTTGNDTDVAISGNGFFVVRDGEQEFYTRAGQFSLDEQGYLSDPKTKYRVAGINSDGSVNDINFNSLQTSAAETSTKATLQGNLDTGTASGASVPDSTATPIALNVIGSDGEAHVLHAVFTKQLGGQWSFQLTDVQGNPVAAPQLLGFAPDGSIRSDSAKFTTTYQPFTILTTAQLQDQFAGSDSISIQNGDLSTASEQTLDIQSPAYWVTRDNGQPSFSRSIALQFNSEGFLIDKNSGQRIAGIDSNGILTDFSLGSLKENPAQATTKVLLNGNLDPSTAVSSTVPASAAQPLTTQIIRSDGSKYDLQFVWTKSAADAWTVQAQDSSGTPLGSAQSVQFDSSGNLQTSNQSFSVTIPNADGSTFDVSVLLTDSTGNLTQKAGSDSVATSALDGLEKGSLQSVQFTNDGFAQLTYSNGKKITGPKLAAVDRGSEDSISLALDLSGITSFSGTSTAAVGTVDGRAAGKLTSFSFANDGQIQLVYSNGTQEKGPQLALAQFQNLNALTSVGSTLFKAGANAGRVVGKPNQGGFGEIQGKSIELSNVELSREFADIIVIQRGYQASSQVMNVSSQLIEQLYNSVKGGN